MNCCGINLQFEATFSVSTIGISCDTGRDGDRTPYDALAPYTVEQCCVFGINKTEYDAISKIGKISPKHFTYAAQRYVTLQIQNHISVTHD